MAVATLNLIDTLRQTAKKLEGSTHYQWGHMGLCNCGFLAQKITRLRKDEIHQRAMERYGDWNEQLNDYCPDSGMRMDDLISEMLVFGFDVCDLKHLEKLSDPYVLQALPLEERNLRHNCREDVVIYLRTWALRLEQDLAAAIELPEIMSLPAVPA